MLGRVPTQLNKREGFQLVWIWHFRSPSFLSRVKVKRLVVEQIFLFAYNSKVKYKDHGTIIQNSDNF